MGKESFKRHDRIIIEVQLKKKKDEKPEYAIIVFLCYNTLEGVFYESEYTPAFAGSEERCPSG